LKCTYEYDEVTFSIVERNGDKIQIVGNVGKTVLDAALEHNIDIEG